MAITRLGPNQDITAAKIAGQINFKNLIINGDMSIAQRGTSFSGTGTRYTIDRMKNWVTAGATGDFTVTQETDVPSNTTFNNSYKLSVDTVETPTGGGNIVFTQHIEGVMTQTLGHGLSSPPQATISFWVKSNKTGIYSLQMKEDTTDEQYVLFEYTINSADTWEKKTITWTGNSNHSLENDNTTRLRPVFMLSSGPDDKVSPTSSWTTSSAFLCSTNQVNLFDSTSNYWQITGLQLEVGTSASDFEFLPYDVNLIRCQRYYQSVWQRASATQDTAYSKNNIGIQLPTVMRVDPTTTVTGGALIGHHNNAPSVQFTNKNGCAFEWTGSDYRSSGAMGRVTFTVDAEL